MTNAEKIAREAAKYVMSELAEGRSTDEIRSDILFWYNTEGKNYNTGQAFRNAVYVEAFEADNRE